MQKSMLVEFYQRRTQNLQYWVSGKKIVEFKVTVLKQQYGINFFYRRNILYIGAIKTKTVDFQVSISRSHFIYLRSIKHDNIIQIFIF